MRKVQCTGVLTACPGIFVTAVLFYLCFLTTAYGQNEETLQIHGYGGWSYGNTDAPNKYLDGTEIGEYENAQFALNLAAMPYDRFRVNAQIQGLQSFGEFEFDLDYAFAEWAVSDYAKFRFGKVKHPFGNYAEVMDVGTIRPFLQLPQSIYSEGGLATEAYSGAGLTGTMGLRKGWSVEYDVYGGQLQFAPNIAGGPVMGMETGEINGDLTEVLGTRANLVAPFGLKMGVSAFRGAHRWEPMRGENLNVVAIHSEYLLDRWWIRGEYGHQRVGKGITVNAGYGELAYKFTSHWQAAYRYDRSGYAGLALPPGLERFLQHETSAFGLNYWFNPNLVLKAAYHVVDGNRYALPEDPEDMSTPERTNLVQFGVQFSF